MIGYTVSRSGVKLDELKEECSVIAANFTLTGNSKESVNALTGGVKRISFAGKRWNSELTFRPFKISDKCSLTNKDDQIRYLRAWIAEHVDEGYFRLSDTVWNARKCETQGLNSTSRSESVTVVLPEIISNDPSLLFPSQTTFPSDNTFPGGLPSGVASIPEYTFTLTANIDVSGNNLLLTQTPVGRVLNVDAVSGSSISFTNNNPWDSVALGIYQEYEDALLQAKKELYLKLNFNSSAPLLRTGDYVQVEEQLFMITKDFKTGDSQINITPPNRHPRIANTLVNYENPTCVMMMVGDASFSASNLRYDSMSIKAVEVIE